VATTDGATAPTDGPHHRCATGSHWWQPPMGRRLPPMATTDGATAPTGGNHRWGGLPTDGPHHRCATGSHRWEIFSTRVNQKKVSKKVRGMKGPCSLQKCVNVCLFACLFSHLFCSPGYFLQFIFFFAVHFFNLKKKSCLWYSRPLPSAFETKCLLSSCGKV